MQAISYPSKGQAQIGNLAEPEAAEHEVVVRVQASGLCHTDVDILHGRYGDSTYPIVPGHEYAGDIVAVGGQVTKFSTGDRVVIDPNFHCGACRPCEKGLTNLCENLGAYGVTKNGGFAEYSAVNQDNIVAIGDMPYKLAALAEPVGCVLNGLEAVDTSDAKNALLFGAGPIGLLMALALRTQGVSDVCMVDLEESRLKLAESFGLNTIHAKSDELADTHQSIDLTIDATGVPAVAEGLIKYTANGGSMLLFGVCPPGETISISPNEVFRRQLTIAGAHSLNHNIPTALATIKSIGPDIERLISHTVPLSEITDFLTNKGTVDTLKVQAVRTGDA